MRTSIVLFLLSLIFFTQAEIQTEDGVYVLTEANFDEFVKGESFTVVEFYAPWCGHCKKLTPEYARAAKALANQDPPVKLAKVDATEQKELGDRFDISGYPTLKIFKNGEVSDYDGPRDAAGIIKYVKSKAGPTSRLLETPDAVQSFINNPSEPGVIYFGDASSSLFSEYQTVSSKLSDSFRFGYTHSDEAAKKFGISGDKIVFFQPQRFLSKLEESKVEVVGSTSDEISTFLETQTFPLAGQLTKENLVHYAKKGLPALVIYTGVDWERNIKGVTYYLNRLRLIGKEFKDKLSFVIASASDFSQEVEGLGFNKNEPAVAIVDLNKNLKYRTTDASKFSVEGVKQLINDYLANKLEPHVKSEPVPTSDDGDVKIVVGKNFNEVVLDSDKDVLLEAYAPWCGHCKKLDPIYRQLASSLSSVKDKLTIAKIDATANDVPPEFAVRGFPTIFFVPANNKKSPIKYEGAREVKDFVKFLKKHATFNFDDKVFKDEL